MPIQSAATMLRDTLYVSERITSSAPGAWQLLGAIAGVAGFLAMCIACGVAYGRLSTRVEVVEAQQAKSVSSTEMELMFEDIKRRLERIEAHVDREHG